MNILQASERAIKSQAAHSHERPGVAVLISPPQYRELCAVAAPMAPKSLCVPNVARMPIYTLEGFSGPAVVDRRLLVILMMMGAKPA